MEEGRRRGMAVLVWKLDGSGTVVDDVVVGGSGVVSGSSRVYRRLKGGRNSKYTAIIAINTKHDNEMQTLI